MENKLPYDQMSDMLAAARTKLPAGTKWRHYRGSEYIVEKIVVLEATNEMAVLYNSASHPDISYVCSMVSWLETVEWNDNTVPRFTKI